MNIYNDKLIEYRVRPFKICTDYLLATPSSGDLGVASLGVSKIIHNSETVLVRERFIICVYRKSWVGEVGPSESSSCKNEVQ